MRKEPKQARSRATVDAIVVAATRVLGQRGWSAFTTNEVAAVAGVSIGSLYQYFPDKLSLADAIRRRHFDEVLDALRRVAVSETTLDEDAASLVLGMLAVHGAYPALHRALLEEVPRGEGSRAGAADFERQYLRCFKWVITKHRGRRGPRRDDMAAHGLASALEGAVHGAALAQLQDSPALKAELVALVSGYLRG